MPLLDCHLADADEKAAAFRNVHEFWGGDTRIDEFVQQRLTSARHNRAAWYVATVDGEVVSSLGAFPFQLAVQGTTQRTCFIGAVHSRPQDRGKGYARRLIEYVEQEEKQQGGSWSVLFSDIDPAYYQRLGYQVSTAPNISIGPHSPEPPESSFTLQPLIPGEQLADLTDCYIEHFKCVDFYIQRTPTQWDFIVDYHRDDSWYWLVDESPDPAGYVLLNQRKNQCLIEDFALRQSSTANLTALVQTLARFAANQGITNIGGWFPQIDFKADWFNYRQRETEITMIKAIGSGCTVTNEMLRQADTFRHVDHV